MSRAMLLAAVLAFALVLTGCKNGEKMDEGATTAPSPGMLNTTCPVSGRPVDPNAPTVDYAGGKVGFCCAACPDRWKALTEEQKKVKAATWAGHGGGPAPGALGGHNSGCCCGGCGGK